MNIVEMYALCKNIYTNNNEEYDYIGLRVEDKVRSIGDTCEKSRHNPNRDDERDFPVYGSDEYVAMQELNGTSAWDLSHPISYKIQPWQSKTNDCREHFTSDHCYVIAGHYTHTHDDADAGEIVIKDAVVIAQIF